MEGGSYDGACHTQNVMPAEAGTHDTFQVRCALDDVERFDACVDGRLRGHDESSDACLIEGIGDLTAVETLR
jgi:hypothetical protein